ncbi:hypothetical protein GJ496_004424 [Pomphorhynchus laevis]|nr:hypothetical protein GJ496_004424 [Pomphorhynchus laevis]
MLTELHQMILSGKRDNDQQHHQRNMTCESFCDDIETVVPPSASLLPSLFETSISSLSAMPMQSSLALDSVAFQFKNSPLTTVNKHFDQQSSVFNKNNVCLTESMIKGSIRQVDATLQQQNLQRDDLDRLYYPAGCKKHCIGQAKKRNQQNSALLNRNRRKKAVIEYNDFQNKENQYSDHIGTSNSHVITTTDAGADYLWQQKPQLHSKLNLPPHLGECRSLLDNLLRRKFISSSLNTMDHVWSSDNNNTFKRPAGMVDTDINETRTQENDALIAKRIRVKYGCTSARSVENILFRGQDNRTLSAMKSVPSVFAYPPTAKNQIIFTRTGQCKYRYMVATLHQQYQNISKQNNNDGINYNVGQYPSVDCNADVIDGDHQLLIPTQSLDYCNIAKEYEHLRLDSANLDSPLHRLGVMQCHNAACQLANINFRLVFISPLQRAIESAYIIFGQHPNKKNIRFIVLPNLTEMLYSSADIPRCDLRSWKQCFQVREAIRGLNMDCSILEELGPFLGQYYLSLGLGNLRLNIVNSKSTKTKTSRKSKKKARCGPHYKEVSSVFDIHQYNQQKGNEVSLVAALDTYYSQEIIEENRRKGVMLNATSNIRYSNELEVLDMLQQWYPLPAESTKNVLHRCTELLKFLNQCINMFNLSGDEHIGVITHHAICQGITSIVSNGDSARRLDYCESFRLCCTPTTIIQ